MFLNAGKRKLNKRIEKYKNKEDIDEFLKESKSLHPTNQKVDKNTENQDEGIALKSK